jgi:hypothetical protein
MQEEGGTVMTEQDQIQERTEAGQPREPEARDAGQFADEQLVQVAGGFVMRANSASPILF